VQVFDLQMWIVLSDQDLRHYYAQLKFSKCCLQSADCEGGESQQPILGLC